MRSTVPSWQKRVYESCIPSVYKVCGMTFSVILPRYLKFSYEGSGYQPAALLFWDTVFWRVWPGNLLKYNIYFFGTIINLSFDKTYSYHFHCIAI